MSKPNPRRQFIASAPTYRLNERYPALEAAVDEATSATSQYLQAYNGLMNPPQGKRRSQKQITRDNNQRKYDFVAAVQRAISARDALCHELHLIHSAIVEVDEMIKTIRSGKTLPSGRAHLPHLQVNFVESCKLLKEGLAALSRMGQLDYEWTIDTYLAEECQAASDWFQGMPELPGLSFNKDSHEQRTAIDLANALSAINSFGKPDATGGFLGDVMYATDVKQPSGGVGVRSANEQDSQSVSAAAKLLRQRGWSVDTDRYDMQIDFPRKA